MTILYCRKSTESEDRQVLSIESQINELKALAERDGLKIDHIFTESMSAKNPESRPEFEAMIKLIQKHRGTTILAWKLDRLARNPVDGGKITWLLQSGLIKEIRTYDRSYLPADNALIMSVELGMANQYIRDLSANVKRGLRTKLEKGGTAGLAPLGYLNNKADYTVYPDSERSHFVVKAFELFATGSYSIKDVTTILHREGFRTRAGRKVHKGAIYKMLNHPFYAGTIRHAGRLYPGVHVPLVSQSLFDVCQNVFSPNRSRPKRHEFPLRGFMSCADCGCSLTATRAKGHVYYYCTNGRGSCSQHKTYMRSEVAESLVAEVFGHIHLDPEIIEIMYLAAKEQLSNQRNGVESSREHVLRQRNSLLNRRVRAEEAYLDGTLSKERFSAIILEINNEEVSLENQLNQLSNHQGEVTLEQTKEAFLTAFSAEKDFLEADESKKSELVKLLLSNLSIKDRKVQQFKLKQAFQLMAEAPKTADISIWLGW